MVLLTAREHFIAHIVEVYKYDGNKRRNMANALWKTCQNSSGQRIISSK